jgi:hypothetical protein
MEMDCGEAPKRDLAMIQPRPEPQKSSASSFFTFTLVFVLGSAFAVLLNLLSMGLFFWVFVLTFAIALIGFAHYILWGHALSSEVAEERERFLRQQAREREDQEGWRA